MTDESFPVRNGTQIMQPSTLSFYTRAQGDNRRFSWLQLVRLAVGIVSPKLDRPMICVLLLQQLNAARASSIFIYGGGRQAM
jgi:hypothetical protein